MINIKIWRVARTTILLVTIILCIGFQPQPVWAIPPYFGFAIQAGGAEDDMGISVAIDAAGNVYVTGVFRGTVDFDPGLGVVNLSSAGGDDVFVIKYAASGTLLWARALHGTDDGIAGGIAVDNTGNVYTVGTFRSTVDFDPGTSTFNLTSAGGADVFVSKLDSGGNFVWARSMGGAAAGEYGRDVAVDGAGNVHTIGYMYSSTADFDPGVGTFNLTNAGECDIFISKLDSNGNFVWAGAMGGALSDYGYSIAVDEQGNVYASSSFQGPADFDPGTGTFNLSSQWYDIAVIKLDSSGNLVWAKAMGGSDQDEGLGIAIDAQGNIYTTGVFYDDTADFDPGPGTFYLTSTLYDVFVSKLDNDGNFVWAKALSGSASEQGVSIDVDKEGYVYTIGTFEGTVDFDPGAGTFDLTSTGTQTIFISQLNGAGNFVWAGALGESDGNYFTDIAVDENGTICMTGNFQGTVDFDPGTGTVNMTSAGGTDVFVSKLTQPVANLSTSSINFGDQVIDTISTAHAVVLENTGGAPLTINSIVAGGDFAQTNNCPTNPSTLATNSSCTINVTFTPTVIGPGNGTLTISSDSVSSPDTVSLTGNGVSPGDSYEDDDDCTQASVIATDGTAQVHNLHQVADADWVQFVATAGTTYLIETADPGTAADNTLELFNQCDGPAQDFADDVFGPTARLTFNCAASGTYYVRVAHHDPAIYGSETTYSFKVQIDPVPPASPRDITATPGDSSISLQWRPNSELDLVGYRLHYGTLSGVYSYTVDINDPNAAAYILGGLDNGTIYYLALSAIDFGGNESTFSDQASAIPDLGADTTVPTVIIQQPAATAFYETTQTTMLIAGDCHDDESHLNYVHIINAANGEQRWDYEPQGENDTFAVGGVPLEMGNNAIVVTVYDTAGNYSIDLLTVNRIEGEGVAIIVAGHNELYKLQHNIYNVTNRAYRLFRQAGFRREHIIYLSPDPQDADLPKDGVDDVDGDGTPASLEAAITTWAADKVGPGVPVFIYLVDHGVQDYFCINGCEEPGRVWADQLDNWLNTLENDTGADTINVIFEACYSGSFIEQANEISAPGRVVIASTAQGLQAYASTDGAFFSDTFLTALENGDTLDSAFTQSEDSVDNSIGVFQEPWLDDNGNATPNDTGEGTLASTRYLLTTMVGLQPTIVEAQATLEDALVMDVAVRKIDLTARVEKGDGQVQTIWAAIYPPSWTPPDVEPGETPKDGADLVQLTDPDGDNLYTGTHVLIEQGAYRVVFQGVDDNGSQAVSHRVMVFSNTRIYLPLINVNSPTIR